MLYIHSQAGDLWLHDAHWVWAHLELKLLPCY
nr:MAG TPA: hypothetical protein [Caudoviricetes sp.]